jgi:hypothetical protein
MGMTVDFDRSEERQLLDGLFATVTYDQTYPTLPAIEPDPDDPDDDGKTDEAVKAEHWTRRTGLAKAAGLDAITPNWTTGPGRTLAKWDQPGAYERVRDAIQESVTRVAGAPLPTLTANALAAHIHRAALGVWPTIEHDGDCAGH